MPAKLHPRQLMLPLLAGNAALSLIAILLADGHVQPSIVAALLGAAVGFAAVLRSVEHPLAMFAAGWSLAANVLTLF